MQPAAPDPHSLPLPDLGAARVAVLGCGSVGGLAAWALASAGVGRLDLADRDRLAEDNLRRHACGRSELGWPKPAAVARFLGARFARLQAREHTFCFLDEPERLRAVLAGCDAAVAAVDGEGARHLIDVQARELGRAVVHAGVYGGGWGAEVILADPSRAPCYACAARGLGRAGVDLEPARGAHPYASRATDRGAWAVADLGSIMPAAALAAQVTLAWLAARAGDDRLLQAWRSGGASAWQLALRPVPAWQAGPWQVRPVRGERFAGCPVCDWGASDEAMGAVRSLLKEAPDAEPSW